MNPRRATPPRRTPPAGIYSLGIGEDGQERWAAWDADEHCEIDKGNDGHWRLEGWLRARGINPSAAALLLLSCCLLAPDALPERVMRNGFMHYCRTGTYVTDYVWRPRVGRR